MLITRRRVHIFDCKIWRARARWNHALKKSVANLCATPAPASASAIEPAKSDAAVQADAFLCFAMDTGTDLGSSLMCGEDSRPADAPKFALGWCAPCLPNSCLETVGESYCGAVFWLAFEFSKQFVGGFCSMPMVQAHALVKDSLQH